MRSAGAILEETAVGKIDLEKVRAAVRSELSKLTLPKETRSAILSDLKAAETIAEVRAIESAAKTTAVQLAADARAN